MAQELLTTFQDDIGELALIPGTGGVFDIRAIALRTGDAAAVSGEEHLALTGGDAESSEILLFDLA